jgi:RecA-family ATPase
MPDLIDFGGLPSDTVAQQINANAIETLDLEKWALVKPTPKRFVIPKLAPAGEVTVFSGAGSAGKSLFAQQVATALASGLPTLRLSLEQAPAIYLTCEDDERELHFRQSSICRALRIPMERLAGSLHLGSLRGLLENELGTFAADGKFHPTPMLRRLQALIERAGAALVCLDNLAHFFIGNENDRGEVTRFMNALNGIAGETGAAILLLGHTNKDRGEYSGSTAWLNAVRSQITIDHDMETDMRTVRVGKANYSRKGDELRFIWIDGAFVHADELAPDQAKELAEITQANFDNERFLACLEERTRQQRAVSEKSCKSYAPSVFERMPESKGIGKKRLEAAMDRLFRTGAIERGVLWRGPDRKDVTGLKLVAGRMYELI